MTSVLIEKAVVRLEKDPLFVRRRSIMVAVFAVRLLAMGIEMSVILPSVWFYIEPMGATPLFMGMVESAYAFGSMVAFPIVGLIYDRTKHTKVIILVLNTLQIIGNVLYAIPASKWCPLFGRLLGGLGDSFAACYLGELTYTFTPTKRIGIISLIGSGRMLGLMIGPAVNFFIEKVSFRIGAWNLDSRNFPGFFMAIVWCMVQGICVCASLGLAWDVIKELSVDTDIVARADEEDIDWTEMDVLVQAEKSPNVAFDSNHKVKYAGVLKKIFCVEYLVLLLVDYVLVIPQHGFNILLPLITEKGYHWSASLTGSLYLAGGLEIILILLCVYLLGHRYPVRETSVLRISLLLMATSMLGLVLESVFRPHPVRVAMLLICFTFLTASASVSMIASKAIITKTTRPAWQGIAHGTYSSMIRIAFICGPVVGGVAYYNRRIYVCVMVACSVVAFVLLELVKGRLHSRQDFLERDSTRKSQSTRF